MKVLWFTNILLPAVRNHLGLPPYVGGAWIEALRSNLEKYFQDISLHIVSFSNTDFEPYTHANATYYPILQKRPSGKLWNILENWKHSRYSDTELQQCVDLINTCKPDLIHVHGSENLFGLVQEDTDVPVVVSLQGLIISCQHFEFPGLGIHDKLRFMFCRASLKGLGPIHNAIEHKTQAQIEKRVISGCKHFMGRTEWDRSIVKLMNPDASYYHVDEILREPFYQNTWDNSRLGDHTVFSTISSAVRKGLLVLLDSIGILKKRGYENILLRLAGSIKGQANWTMIKKRITNNQIESNVEFLGPLIAEDLSIELANNSVFVHPSYIDNSPNSLAEAMMVGIPCVATAVGGVPSMLEHGKEGLLCTPGDPYSIAAAINRILSDKGLSEKLSTNARKKALEYHNPKRITNNLYHIYKDIIAYVFV
ncbi:MAG: glycosyltransferase [Candidatus Aegiribacteria sp.]|nr:glycosyltransferase [Candidatus Aegiribacteria sp.]